MLIDIMFKTYFSVLRSKSGVILALTFAAYGGLLDVPGRIL
jgi:hypothetical protein